MHPFSSEPALVVTCCPQCGRVLTEGATRCPSCGDPCRPAPDRTLDFARCLLLTLVLPIIGLPCAIVGCRFVLASLPGKHFGLGSYPGAPGSMGITGMLIAVLPLTVVGICIHQLYVVWRRYGWWRE